MLEFDPTEKIEELRERLAEARGFLDLAGKEAELAELRQQAADPDLWNNPDEARDVTRKLARFERLIELIDGLETGIDDSETLLELVSEEGGDLADSGIGEELEAVDERLQQLELESLFFDEYDDHPAIITIHAGAGGVDAQDWVEILLRAYVRYAERKDYNVRVEEVSEGEQAGLKSVTFTVRGENAYGTMLSEKGVHRLVRISPFDSQSRRHTSFAGVDIVPEVEVDETIEVSPDELRIDTFRAQGAGGQHVNTTDSAVRITHVPTGVVVSCQAERSQIQNRARAMVMLHAKLAERARQEREEQMAQLRGENTEAAWGRQIRSYTMQPFQLVKDLRTGIEIGNIQAVLDGDFDDLTEAFLRWRREQQETGGD